MPPSSSEQPGEETNRDTSEEVRLFEQKFQKAVQAEQEQASREATLALIHDAWLVAQDIGDEDKRRDALEACDRVRERLVGLKPNGSKDEDDGQDFHSHFDHL